MVDTQEARRSGTGLGTKLLGLVLLLAAVYLGAFLLWRAQLESVDGIAADSGLEGGLPEWIDGGNQILIVDDDSRIDSLGFSLFTPLVALEESLRDVNYFETGAWKFWRD